MRWKKLYNKAGEEYAIVSECNRWQIASYKNKPLYCLFEIRGVSKVIACANTSKELVAMVKKISEPDRSSAT